LDRAAAGSLVIRLGLELFFARKKLAHSARGPAGVGVVKPKRRVIAMLIYRQVQREPGNVRVEDW